PEDEGRGVNLEGLVLRGGSSGQLAHDAPVQVDLEDLHDAAGGEDEAQRPAAVEDAHGPGYGGEEVREVVPDLALADTRSRFHCVELLERRSLFPEVTLEMFGPPIEMLHRRRRQAEAVLVGPGIAGQHDG